MNIKTGLGLKRKTKKILSLFKPKKLLLPKIFGIGLNKTGTTSLTKAMELLGFTIGSEYEARLLFDDWVKRDFQKLSSFCEKAHFFQDFPFSLPYTFIAMDQAFPKSKFILTIRDSSDQWYHSNINYMAKKWGKNNVVPSAEDLKNSTFMYKGHHWHAHQAIFDVNEEDPWNKEILIEHYIRHNKNVTDYFRHRPEDLLVLNVAEKDALKKLVNFLGLKSDMNEFPWENKSAKIK